MTSTITLIFLSISVLCVEINCQLECRPIGTSAETELTVVRDHKFYLNTAHPAPCGGTIESWRYCFYRPAGMIAREDRFRARWAVYRRMGSGNNTYYMIVESSLRTLTRNDPSSGNFWCRNDNRPDFDIVAGDIVGACIYEPTSSNRKQLDIVSEANGYSLMQIIGDSQCGDNSMPSRISSSQLSIVDSRLLHLSATITNPTTTPPPTTTMSTTELSTTAIWTTSIPSDTTTVDVTTAASDGDISVIIPTSSSPETPTIKTSVSNPTTQSTLSESPFETTSREADITTQTNATSQSMATTGNITVIYYYRTSAETDTMIVVSTIAQISAQKMNFEIIIGVTIVVALLVVTGIAVAIIVAVVFKKFGKSNGSYSLPGKQPQSNGTVRITSNGVDNLTYDVGFHNPGILDSSFNLYDDVANSVSVNTGEGNYFELAESGISNQTYESVAAGIYSELSAVDTQANSNHQNPSDGISCSQLEYYYSSPEDSQEFLSSLLEQNKQEDIYGNLAAYCAPASNEDEIYSQLQTCGTNNIPHNQIRIMGHLGSGQFGNVEKGMWQSKEVALKTLRTDSLEEDKVKFLQEAAIMAQFKHPNIVTLYGVVSDKQPLMLVVELMHRGDLRDHLHSIRPDPGELPMAGLSGLLLGFSQHVALGMQYLSGKGFVHRDLAARNILVSKDNICKVADFGMSRDLADETYYVSHGGMIPVKWTAPEAIHYKKYSTASDVWSYGCLLYEIWSLGWKPFEGITNVEVIKILDSNKRLSPPPGCPRMIYELMIKCWDPIASGRPRFRELTIVLTGNPHDVLSIPQEALHSHKLAGVLGSPLEAGKNMYSDLQKKYCSENNIII